jgi:ribulose-phosphate 3-epimerase
MSTQPRNPVRLAPSILSADFANLGPAVAAAEDAGADLIHVDIMDGQFVPNISIGPAVVAAVKRHTSLPLDVHLMIATPGDYVTDFVSAGADYLTVHAEVTHHLHRLLQSVRESGVKVGLALNPLTPLTVLEGALAYLDLALVMSVNPGFGGQEFIGGSVARIEAARRMRDRVNPNCLIEVDGGINQKTAPLAVAAGADILVAGSAVYGGGATVRENVAGLRAAIASAL